MSEKLQCEKHGEQSEAFVCSHIVETLADRKPRGIVWSRDEDGSINAYCDACDAALKEAGGDWTDELQDKAGIGLVCEACILPAFALNGVAAPA